jgi:Tfp pilus assembly protein FimT
MRMKKTFAKYVRGFSTLEIIAVVSIMLIITGIVLVSSSSSIRFYELNRVTHSLASLIKKARVQSVYSENASKYSIKLFEDRAVLFAGTTYTEGTPTNEVYSFGSRVELATTSLDINSDIITFDRITGKTDNFGTIILWAISATTTSSTIKVGKTGIIEVQ